MITIISLLGLIGGIALYVMATGDFWMLEEHENKEIKSLALCLIMGSVIILLINSWIVKPIILIFGG